MTPGRGPTRRSLLRAQITFYRRELLRIPSFTIPSLLLPVVFYAMFGAPAGDDLPLANELMVGYAGFAMLGVVLFDFGVSVAVEREHPWSRFVRTLPGSASVRLASRVVVGVTVGLTASSAVSVAAVVLTSARLTAGAWLAVAAALVVGSIPFAALGLAIGHWVPARGASPVASLLYLPLSFAGGLWGDPQDLPAGVDRVSWVLPTRAWRELLGDALDTRWPDGGWLLSIVGWTAAFGTIAAAGLRHAAAKDRG
jgi:ABC-2 type transport system permease protein